jgi:hypothetical protein
MTTLETCQVLAFSSVSAITSHATNGTLGISLQANPFS